MPGLSIALWIVSILALLYALWGIYCTVFLINFRDKMAKRLVALSILFEEKKEVLLSLYALYDKAKVPLDDADKDAAMKVRWLKAAIVKDDDVKSIVSTLSDLERRLTLLSEEESYIKESEDFVDYMATLADLEASYHRIAAAYNSDLLGYEYWRKRPLYRWIFFLCRFREKQRIS